MLKDLFPWAYADNVFAIDYEKLRDLGYRGLVFDIDNTLVLHGADSTPEVDALLCRLHQMGWKTVLLSNNSQERILRFLAHIDAPYVAEADKPAPEGYEKALALLDLPREQVLVVGDQIFTDIYGANRCGIGTILVHYLRRPGEWWPGKRRVVEKLLLCCWRLLPRSHPLGEIVKKERRPDDAGKTA